MTGDTTESPRLHPVGGRATHSLTPRLGRLMLRMRWSLWRFKAGLGALCLATLPALAAPPCAPPAPQPTPERIAQAKAQARDRGFLWRIVKSERISYLYGTLHVGKLEWVFPGPQVSTALQASEVLALEFDLQDPAMMAEVQRGMAQAPDAEPLPDSLMRRLRAQMRAACLPEAAQQQLLDKVSPEMALTTLVLLSARQDGLEASYSVDLMLSRIGHAAGKQVVSLEDPASQLALLSAESPQALREGLDQGLRSLENRSAQRGMRRVARVWADSRFDELQRYSEWCECMDTVEQRSVMKKVLDDRNIVMAERIDDLHGSGQTVFAAVGSLHLVGPMGLPSLLTQRGYQVERVDASRGRR